MKDKRVLRQFITLIAICLITALANILYLTSSSASLHDEIRIDDGWYAIVNGQDYGLITISEERFPMFNLSDEIIISNVIPDNLMTHPDLRIYSTHAAVDVIIDGKLRYTYGHEQYDKDELIGYGYHYIELEQEDAGKEVVVKYLIHENAAFSMLETPIIANGDYIIRDFMIQNRYRASIILFVIMFGLVSVVVSVLYSLKKRRIVSLAMIGLFSTSIGMWSLCNTNIMGLFTYDLKVKTFMEFGSLYLAPVFLFAYFKDEIKKEGKMRYTIYNVILWTQIVFTILAWLLQITNIVRFPAMLKCCHVLMVAMMVFIIARFVIDMVHGRVHISPIVYGFEFLAVFAVTDLLRYNVLKFVSSISSDHYISLVYVGVLIFVITMLADFGIKYVNGIYERAETEALAKLAYTDSLTGLANRRAIEDVMGEIELEGSKEYAIIAYDLNNLKVVNDTLGHEEGDRYIKEFAKALSDTFSDYGRCARSGGDEFTTVIAKAKLVDIDEVLLRLDKKLEEINRANKGWSMSVAYGYCRAGEEGTNSVREASIVADSRMYEKKRLMQAGR